MGKLLAVLKKVGMIAAVSVLKAVGFFLIAVLAVVGFVGFFLSEFSDSEKMEFIGMGMLSFALGGGWLLTKIWPDEANADTATKPKNDT